MILRGYAIEQSNVIGQVCHALKLLFATEYYEKTLQIKRLSEQVKLLCDECPIRIYLNNRLVMNESLASLNMVRGLRSTPNECELYAGMFSIRQSIQSMFTMVRKT